MPRGSRFTLQNSFGRGLITEATALTFPENACTEADNCIFSPFGVSSRRLGFDFENSFETEINDVSGNVIVTYLWKNVASEGDLVFVVVQIGDFLYFYRVDSDAPLSSSRHANVVDLHDYMPVGVVSVSNLECQFSSGNGILFVTNKRLNSFKVEYDPDTDAISSSVIDIQIRDFEGDRADTLDVDERPTSTLGGLDGAHRYNLENQGWTDDNLTAWDTARTDMPSNADVAWYFKDTSNAFDFSTVDDRSIGNSQAPRGHFIYSIYNINRSANGGTTDFTAEVDRVTTSAFFAGRLFFSGLKGLGQSSRIFFSQIVEEPSQYGKCYQRNDPTSEQSFELLPSDGGLIDLLEAGTIIKMVPLLNTLLVFATNGVWSITGSQGIGFTANDYSINKISAITNVSDTSFVDVEGIPYWWNLEGIYTVSLDPQSNALRVISITDQSIRTFFTDIPSESKLYARGVYDQYTKRIQWIYKSRESTSFNDKYVYDRFLNYDLLSRGFYPWSVDHDGVKIHSITNVFGFSGIFENENVTDGGILVTDGGDPVIAFVATSTSTISLIKYFVSYEDDGDNLVTFAENYKTSFLDWESYDDEGQNFTSYFVTGYAIRGGGFRKFQTNYINVFTLNDVNSSYKIRGQWNYSTSPSTGKWTTEQTFTVLADGFSNKFNRIKIRGHGIACQLRIENNANNPFNIVGWAVMETGNSWI